MESGPTQAVLPVGRTHDGPSHPRPVRLSNGRASEWFRLAS
ncbi:MAG: hypothetical protein ACQESR_14240 [Planctomycetota bacterium]